jgi:hypothetical protein
MVKQKGALYKKDFGTKNSNYGLISILTGQPQIAKEKTPLSRGSSTQFNA